MSNLTSISDTNIFFTDDILVNNDIVNKKYRNTYKNIQIKNELNQLIHPIPLNRKNIYSLMRFKDNYSNINFTLPNDVTEYCDYFIAHVGVGGFHRSHQAYYINEINKQNDKKWGIIGIGLCNWDETIYKNLKSQNFLYSLVSRSPDKCNVDIINSIKNFVFIPKDDEQIQKLIHNKIKILSLTVTEKGYYFDSNYNLDTTNSNIQDDINNWNIEQGLKQPKTIYGLIATMCLLRDKYNLDPLTIMSCDNIPKNGDLTKKLCLQFVSQLDKQLVKIIDSKIEFPNSMVDRITPYINNTDKFLLQLNYNLMDKSPVVSESFIQWVIENKYSNSFKPKWSVCDSIIETNNVEPYEKTKLLLLNSSHSFLAYFGYLYNVKYIYQTVENNFICSILRKYMDEIQETLDCTNDIVINSYINITIERFKNYYIQDELFRIGQDGSQKLKTTLHDCLLFFYLRDKSNPPEYISLLLALFIYFMNNNNENICDPLKNDILKLNINETPIRNLSVKNIQEFYIYILDDNIVKWNELVENIYKYYILIRKREIIDYLKK